MSASSAWFGVNADIFSILYYFNWLIGLSTGLALRQDSQVLKKFDTPLKKFKSDGMPFGLAPEPKSRVRLFPQRLVLSGQILPSD